LAGFAPSMAQFSLITPEQASSTPLSASFADWLRELARSPRRAR